MKYRDKLIKYFEEAPEGAVIVANDMYEKGFTKMSHDAFFRAVERLCDDGIIVRAGKGMYIKAGSKIVYSQGFGVDDRNLSLEGEGYFVWQRPK